jgi:hypothetical protein
MGMVRDRLVINQLRLVQTETGLKTSENHDLWSFCGLVQSFWLLGKFRPVMVMVKSHQHQKTGLD